MEPVVVNAVNDFKEYLLIDLNVDATKSWCSQKAVVKTSKTSLPKRLGLLVNNVLD